MTYDLNGNTKTEQGKAKSRLYAWTEENWLRQVVDGGDVTSFLYDGSGERVVKRGKFGEAVYLGQFFTVTDAATTKHLFAGQTRIASKLVAAPAVAPGAGGQPGFPEPPGAVTQAVGIARACEVGLGLKVGLQGRCPGSVAAQQGTGGSTGSTTLKTWYHPDHLGSVTYVTGETGQVLEHVEYFPYGEAWREEGPKQPVSEFRFTGKIEDPETRLTYFGARYYDPHKARWISADPAIGNGSLGAEERGRPLAQKVLCSYCYVSGSPVGRVDRDGRRWGDVPIQFSTWGNETREPEFEIAATDEYHVYNVHIVPADFSGLVERGGEFTKISVQPRASKEPDIVDVYMNVEVADRIMKKRFGIPMTQEDLFAHVAGHAGATSRPTIPYRLEGPPDSPDQYKRSVDAENRQRQREGQGKLRPSHQPPIQGEAPRTSCPAGKRSRPHRGSAGRSEGAGRPSSQARCAAMR